MAIHTFICDGCGMSTTDTQSKTLHTCQNCCSVMRWDLGNVGILDGDYCHESHSLAIHPDQIQEHKKLFPDIDVKPDGVLVFHSPKQQEKYANTCGFDKKPQKNRHKGIRIA